MCPDTPDGSDGGELAGPTALARPTRITPDGAVITVITGGEKGVTANVPGNVGGRLRIGKAPDNDLVLSDPAVSRYAGCSCGVRNSRQPAYAALTVAALIALARRRRTRAERSERASY